MRPSRRAKAVIFVTLFVLYATGVLCWVLKKWFQIDRGFGPEPSPLAIWSLHFHSIVSFWFLGLFGYLVHSHMLPAWRAKQKLKTGWALVISLMVPAFTAPGLLYITSETYKYYVTFAHVYIGLSAICFFLWHLKTRKAPA